MNTSVSSVLATERLALQKAQLVVSMAAMVVSKARMVARGTSALALGPIGALKGAGIVAATNAIGANNLQMVKQLANITTQQTAWATINQLQAALRYAHGGKTTLILQQIHDQIALIKQAEKDALMIRDLVRNAIPDIMKLVREVQDLSDSIKKIV